MHTPVVDFFREQFAQAGVQMTGQSEFNSRAGLCRKLAQREPANRALWMAEAENWARLSKENLHGADSVKTVSGIFARLREQSSRLLLILIA